MSIGEVELILILIVIMTSLAARCAFEVALWALASAQRQRPTRKDIQGTVQNQSTTYRRPLDFEVRVSPSLPAPQALPKSVNP